MCLRRCCVRGVDHGHLGARHTGVGLGRPVFPDMSVAAGYLLLRTISRSLSSGGRVLRQRSPQRRQQILSSKHTARLCRECGVHVTIVNWDEHVAGRAHRKAAAASPAVNSEVRRRLPANSNSHFRICALCKVEVTAVNWREHVTGRAHRRAAAAETSRKTTAANAEPICGETAIVTAGADGASATPDGGRQLLLCPLCDTQVPSSSWEAHTTSGQHSRAMDVVARLLCAAAPPGERRGHRR